MTIEFNKVTWYSKLAAVLFFAVLPVWSFYLGVEYGKASEMLSSATKALEADTSAAPKRVDIAGSYAGDGNIISITRSASGRYSIKGNATWEGENAEFGQVSSGNIDGPLTVIGDKGRYSDDGCEVDFVFSGAKLIATDNNRCGGLNVSFTGEYAKQ